jgi:hypothetical protein
MPGNPPVGFIPQYYRDAHGYSFEELKKRLDTWLDIGCTGAAVHGFVGELDPLKFEKHAKEITARGMKAYAAFGMGSTEPEKKGLWVAAVANHPLCSGVLFDMEGAWENEATDKPGATRMGKMFRDQAKDAWACDQPWPVPTVHWSMFPWEEIADFVDARAPQFYYNDWHGPKRYPVCEKMFRDAWKKLDERLKKTGRVDPELVTIQGYAWNDIFPDLVACLLDHPTAFIWSEPWPSAALEEALRILQVLEKHGFSGPDAVLAFQHDHNRFAARKISEDNRCGLQETGPAILGRPVHL